MPTKEVAGGIVHRVREDRFQSEGSAVNGRQERDAMKPGIVEVISRGRAPLRLLRKGQAEFLNGVDRHKLQFTGQTRPEILAECFPIAHPRKAVGFQIIGFEL